MWAVVSVSELEASLQNALKIVGGVTLDWGRLVSCAVFLLQLSKLLVLNIDSLGVLHFSH